MKPMVSIITVSYNAEQCIAETIESVLAQRYQDYEYVFIDGESADQTLEIIESYRESFADKGIHYVVKSGRDHGIYDAMNKGVREAGGQWILMLNAGDLLSDENALADVFCEDLSHADVVFGDAVLRDGEYYKIAKAGPIETITQTMPLCHQSVFVKQSILLKYGFNTQYKLAADYDQLLRCYMDARVFRYMDRLISVYDVSGVSEKSFRRTLTEQKRIREQFGLKTPNPISYTMLLRLRARLIKYLLPSVSRSESRGWYRSLDRIKKLYSGERT